MKPYLTYFSFLLLVFLASLSVHTTGKATDRAHERRIIGGKYDVIVGWMNEPTYLNEPNAAIITIRRVEGRDRVADVEKTLKVKIGYGGNAPTEYALQTTDTIGTYIAPYTPTQLGGYVFTFVGKIETLEIHEVFESGAGRFDDVILNPAATVAATVENTAASNNAVSDAANTSANNGSSFNSNLLPVILLIALVVVAVVAVIIVARVRRRSS